MASMNSKEAQASLIDPFTAPQPSEETGLNAHFGSTMPAKQPTTEVRPARTSSLSTNNPFNKSTTSPTSKAPGVTERPLNSHPFPDYQHSSSNPTGTRPLRSASNAQHPPAYSHDLPAPSTGNNTHGRRRTSSLRERFPGDTSVKPLEILRKDSKKAHRSPHLQKRNMQGPDVIDRLDPALGGRAYHHEGPYDAAAFARNRVYDESSPVAALKTSNEEALRATPKENVKDAVQRHKPLDGVAVVPPGVPDQFGRTYEYEEGTDMMREGVDDAGYKRWPGKDYDPDDLSGKSEPAFSLDRALRAHKIDDDGIEMEDHARLNKDYAAAKRRGTLDNRDPVHIAGDDGKYAELEYKNSEEMRGESVRRTGSVRQAVGEGLKKRIGSLRHRKDE